METLLWCKYAYYSHTHTREAVEKEEEYKENNRRYTRVNPIIIVSACDAIF